MSADTRSWDVAEHLDSAEAIAAYIDAAMEDGDPTLISAALGDVARAIGMTQIANETGLARESLYRSLSAEGHPELATVAKVLKAFGLRLAAVPDEGDLAKIAGTRAGEKGVPVDIRALEMPAARSSKRSGGSPRRRSG